MNKQDYLMSSTTRVWTSFTVGSDGKVTAKEGTMSDEILFGMLVFSQYPWRWTDG